MAILYAFLIITGIGALLGFGLAVADKFLTEPKDEKLEALEEMMPGANCGGCGFAGCSAYAEAVYKGKVLPGLCAPGGVALANKMAEVLGVEVQMAQKKVAYIFCSGSCENTTKDYDYKGIQDCNAAAMLFKGDNGCKSGCLHLGSCMAVCEYNAIYRKEDGTLAVDASLCQGCGRCTKVCPNGVIKLIPADAPYVVACNSHEKGADVRKVCSVGCIGCKICEVKFPEAGFKVDQNLACAKYEPSYNIEEMSKAAEACPRHIIKAK